MVEVTQIYFYSDGNLLVHDIFTTFHNGVNADVLE